MNRNGRKLGAADIAKMLAARVAKAPTLAERFWRKVDKRGDDECWPWKGSLHEDGYGQLWMDGRVQRAHRASLRVHGMEPPPYENGRSDGYVVDHACRNPACVNPRHLRIVTQRENCTVLADRSKAQARRRATIAANPKHIHCGCGRKFVPQGYYKHRQACPHAMPAKGSL